MHPPPPPSGFTSASSPMMSWVRLATIFSCLYMAADIDVIHCHWSTATPRRHTATGRHHGHVMQDPVEFIYHVWYKTFRLQYQNNDTLYCNSSVHRPSNILKLLWGKYPAIHTYYSYSNCTISNYKLKH